MEPTLCVEDDVDVDFDVEFDDQFNNDEIDEIAEIVMKSLLVASSGVDETSSGAT